MQLDCRNLVCPEPVIKTKDVLNGLKIGEILEILVNSTASKENVKKFLSLNSLEYEVQSSGEETIIKTTKTKNLQNLDPNFSCDTKNVGKIIYLNDDKAGSGEVGRALLGKFLEATINISEKPLCIICVNNAVFMTTNRGSASFYALKKLEELGVEILSCGSCLEAYKLVDKLAIGRITNAYEIMNLLNQHEVIKL